jgi:hypothetical protein
VYKRQVLLCDFAFSVSLGIDDHLNALIAHIEREGLPQRAIPNHANTLIRQIVQIAAVFAINHRHIQ